MSKYETGEIQRQNTFRIDVMRATGIYSERAVEECSIREEWIYKLYASPRTSTATYS